MPSSSPVSERVMLLLPPPLAKFADYLVETTSPPFKTLTRQEAIRNVLAHLMTQMKFNPSAEKRVYKPRTKASK